MSVTALANAWVVKRFDGRNFGFCDHDRALTVDHVICEPSAALTASEAATSLGLAADELDASGALSSATLTEGDIVAGLWDGAEVKAYVVNWETGETRLTGRYSFGGMERSGGAFRVELRSRAAGLDRPNGRSFLATCDARLGDARCMRDLEDDPALRGGGTIQAASDLVVKVAVGNDLDIQRLARGHIRMLSGDASGLEFEIRSAVRSGSQADLILWRRPPIDLQPGDEAELTVGCDKTYQTCRNYFDNGINFRGFPFMPGKSALTETALRDDPALDGGSRFGSSG